MKNKVFFFHIAKTAGSSFNHFLAQHYLGETHCERYLTGNLFPNLDQLRTLDYISGHLRFSTFLKSGFLQEDYFLLTFIREPIAQLLSHLNWVIYIYDISPAFFNAHPQPVREMSLQLRALNLYDTDSFIYALETFSGWFQNNQSRYFNDCSESICKDGVIEAMSQLDMIGLTEHYEQSLRHFANLKQLHFSPGSLEVVNKNPYYRVGRNILENPSIHEFLITYNQIDLEVYEYFYPRIRQAFAQEAQESTDQQPTRQDLQLTAP